MPGLTQTQYQNNDWKTSKSGGAHFVPDSGVALRYEIEARVTEQRLANVVSKIGRIDPADRVACRQLLDCLQRDVLESLVDESVLEPGSLQEMLPGELGQCLEKAARILVVRHIRKLQAQHAAQY